MRASVAICLVGLAFPVLGGAARAIESANRGLVASGASASVDRSEMDIEIASLRHDIHREIDGLRRDFYLLATGAGVLGSGITVAVDNRRRGRRKDADHVHT